MDLGQASSSFSKRYSKMISKFFLFICASLAVTGANAIVSGLVFDRYISIWLENTDFSSASADRKWSPNSAEPISHCIT